MSLPTLDWQEGAACAGEDPELFFPDRGRPNDGELAQRICLDCPIRRACLDHALEHNESYGVWGGLSGRQRRRVRALMAEGCDLATALDIVGAPPFR